jgi:hypothetical protein
MGLFGYKFISLTPDQVAERRIHLDHYANIAQFSQVIIIFIAVVGPWIATSLLTSTTKQVLGRPSSPESKHISETRNLDWRSKGLQTWRTLQWRLGDVVSPGYGSYGQWIGGTFWSLWLLYLCIDKTVPG